ncbi:kinesin-like protein KIF12 [Euwallacea fornicatus]|uniref:kinesin-like protein KIF12 n=1 Tax=Euwallacea fornicatus TaxID=995702 RepID=UPI00338F53CB
MFSLFNKMAKRTNPEKEKVSEGLNNNEQGNLNKERKQENETSEKAKEDTRDDLDGSPVRSRQNSSNISSVPSTASSDVSQDKSIKSNVYRSGRSSEAGSIERLNEDNSFRKITTSYNKSEDNINVVVRVRPLNKKEIDNGYSEVVEFPGNGQIMVHAPPNGPNDSQKPKLFSYNVVFEPAATQEDVLQFSGMKKLISMALEGFRCTCFCYGQTGSGKTHTLTGPPGLIGSKGVPYSENHGLIFRSFMYLFQQIQQQSNTHFILKASYLEIYNEKVIDLLNAGSIKKPLAVRWSKKASGFFVENLFTVDCEEFDDLVAVLEEGLKNRSIGKHNMNDHSSRSHTILTVLITSEHPAENGVFISRTGKINFVDLAGSEMTKKTHSEGKMLEEANNINKSLMVLGYCISSLSDPKKKNQHVPYRDSKLTKLLADSLAGNGVTLMVACVSPAKFNVHETLNTLRYASRAKRIVTKPVVLMDPREALILTLKKEIDTLETENKHLKTALHIYSSSTPSPDKSSNKPKTLPQVDLDNLAKVDENELMELVRLYVKENGDLQAKNDELFNSKELLQRDHEMVCRENERLSKKLEELTSGKG